MSGIGEWLWRLLAWRIAYCVAFQFRIVGGVPFLIPSASFKSFDARDPAAEAEALDWVERDVMGRW